MAAKSIIEIDVKDEKFQKFLKEYTKYQKTLMSSGEIWKEVGEATEAASENIKEVTEKTQEATEEVQKTSDAMKDVSKSAKETADAAGKIGTNAKEAADALQDAAEAAKETADATKETLDNTKETLDATRETTSASEEHQKQLEESGEALAAMLAAATALALEYAKSSDESEKTSENNDKSAKSTKTIRENLKGAAGFVKDTTLNLIKWQAVISAARGLSGSGGLFGVERLALSAGSSQRVARGLGVSTGEEQAFGVNFGRYVDPDSLLKNVTDSKNDYSRLVSFNQLGISDAEDKSSADLSTEVLQAARELYRTGDHSVQNAQSHGLDNFMSMDEWRRLGTSSDQEFNDQLNKYAKDRTGLDQNTQTQTKWQDFNEQLDRAGTQIRNTFIEGLIPLEPGLNSLSEATVKLIKEGMASPEMKDAITWVAAKLHDLGEYLKSGKLEEDFKKGEKEVIAFTDSVKEAAKWIKSWFSNDPSSSGSYDNTINLSGDKAENSLNQETGNYTSPDFAARTHKWHFDVSKGAAVPDDPDASIPFGLDTPSHTLRKFNRSLGFHQEGIDANGRSIGEPGYNPRTDPTSDLYKEMQSKADVSGNALDIEKETAKKYGVDQNFASSIFKIEGGLYNDNKAKISTAGAIGAGQLMPGTAKELGVNPFDLRQNIDGSVRYLKQLLDHFKGDQEKAAASYNFGQGNVEKTINQYGNDWKSHLPRETSDYLNKMSKYFADKDSDAPSRPLSPGSAGSKPAIASMNKPSVSHVNITVSNPAGANIHTSVNQVAT